MGEITVALDRNTRKILSGATWLTVSAIILKVIGLIYKIPMSYILGDEGMGYFNSAYTVYTVFYIIGSAGIAKAVSILSAKSSPGEAKKIFSITFKLYFIIGIALTMILIFFSRAFSILISNENSFFTILAIAPSVFFVCLSGVIRGYLNGRAIFAPIAISETIGGVSKLFLGLVLANYASKCGFSLPIISAFSIMGITLGSFLGFLYLYIYYAHESRDIKKEFIKTKSVIKEVAKIGIPIVLSSALSSLVNVIDLSLIMNRLTSSGYSESVSSVIYGNYTTLAVPMFTFAATIINTVTMASLPLITSSFASRKYDQLEKSADTTISIALFFSIPSFVAFLFFSPEILSLIFEITSATLGAAFLCALSPAVLFYTFLSYANTIHEGPGNVKYAVGSLIIGALTKCVLSYVLIGNQNFGILGAPLGTCISYMVSALISVHYLRKENRIKSTATKYILKAFLPTSFSLLIAITVKYYLKNLLGTRSSSLVILSVFALFYIVFSLFSTTNKKIRKLLSSKLTKN